jgi:hypothetical protein
VKNEAFTTVKNRGLYLFEEAVLGLAYRAKALSCSESVRKQYDTRRESSEYLLWKTCLGNEMD